MIMTDRSQVRWSSQEFKGTCNMSNNVTSANIQLCMRCYWHCMEKVLSKCCLLVSHLPRLDFNSVSDPIKQAENIHHLSLTSSCSISDIPWCYFSNPATQNANINFHHWVHQSHHRKKSFTNPDLWNGHNCQECEQDRKANCCHDSLALHKASRAACMAGWRRTWGGFHSNAPLSVQSITKTPWPLPATSCRVCTPASRTIAVGHVQLSNPSMRLDLRVQRNPSASSSSSYYSYYYYCYYYCYYYYYYYY